jgi:4-amino-4-deoxy-L-arabinose transferase-like glycosyltransferase
MKINLTRKDKWGLIGLSVLFLSSRLFNLLLFPIFADEAIYIHWSQLMWQDQELTLLSLVDGKQPLYMLFLIPLLRIFRNPLFAGRFLSIVFGFFTLLGIWFLGRKIFGRGTAWIGSFLYVLAPFSLFYDRLALVETLLAAFAVWILFWIVCLVEEPTFKTSLVLGILLGGALWTKSTALSLLFLFPSLFFLFSKRSKNQAQLLKIMRLFLLSILLGWGIYNLLRLSAAFPQIAQRNRDYVFSVKEILKEPLRVFPDNLANTFNWLGTYLTWPIFGLGLISFLEGVARVDRKKILLGFWFFLTVLVMCFMARVFTARYIFFLTPFFLILVASFLVEMIIFFEKRNKQLLAFLILAFLLPACWFDFWLLVDPQKAPIPQRERSGYLEEWSSGYGISKVTVFLKERSKTQKVVVATEGYFGTLPDGLAIFFHQNPQVEIFGIGQPIHSLPESLKETSREFPTFLVVNDSRMFAQSDPTLSLLEKFPKASGLKGRENLLLYQVYEK